MAICIAMTNLWFLVLFLWTVVCMFDGKKNLFYETEVPIVKNVDMVVFWDVMLCTLLDHISSILQMGAVFSIEMLIITQLSNEICPTVKLCNFIYYYYFF
jgi:hypothetical protein